MESECLFSINSVTESNYPTCIRSYASLRQDRVEQLLKICNLTKVLAATMLAIRFLTPSLRRPCIHAIFFPTACRTTCKHAFCFLRVRPEAVSTRHSWLWQTLDDVYTRRRFSESEGTRFGAPGQKALPSGNEWTEWNEWMDFCLIPLSTTGSVEVPGTNL